MLGICERWYWGEGLLVVVREGRCPLQVLALRVVGSGRWWGYAGLHGACTTPLYVASRDPALPLFLVSVEIGLQSHGDWGNVSF